MCENKIDEFINIASLCIYEYFQENCIFGISFKNIYPYINEPEKNSLFEYYKIFMCENLHDCIGDIYEKMMPLKVKKDIGQFYTKNSEVIQLMIDKLDILNGKILEPSCGSGLFLVHLILTLIEKLKRINYSSEAIINYVCDNIYANDIDENALKITELNMISVMLPLIVDAKNNNPNFVMKRLNITKYDFIQKDYNYNQFSIVIGNPPFVTMYGKQSRNMTEEKRAYYNTFEFVLNKKGNNKFNSSMFFVENGMNILKEKGTLNYILDIAFFETAFKDLRKYIVQNYYINSLVMELNEFENVASGQVILSISKKKEKNKCILLFNYETKEQFYVDQNLWDNPENDYKFFKPLASDILSIKEKIDYFQSLEEIFPGKSLRTCCALTGRTDDFLVDSSHRHEKDVFPYIEGSKGLPGKFAKPNICKYIKYDYDLQIEISNEFKRELELKGVKNKKRVTLGDKEAYLSNKIFIRQSANEIIATFCDKPYAANNSIYILTTKEHSKENEQLLMYVCGILNSDLITFYARICHIIRIRKGKTPQIKISDLKKVKIAISDEYFHSIINIVKELLNNPSNQEAYEKLNELVYYIYGITGKEKRFIDEYINSNEHSL